MKITRYTVVALTTVWIITRASVVEAGYFNAIGQSTEGGTESNLYGSNSLVVQNTVTSNGLVQGAGVDKGVGIGASPTGFYSEHYQVYYIPISYTFLHSINVSASIPYISKKVEDQKDTFKASGLGDVSGGISVFGNYMEGMIGTTSIRAVFPTGDTTSSDKGYYIPLGAGGYAFNLEQSLSQAFGDFRVYLNAGIIYSLKTKKIIAEQTEYQFQKGPVYSGLLGFEYTIFNMFVLALKFNYVYITEGQVKTQWTGWVDAQDSLQTSDVIAGLKFIVWKDVLSVFVMYMQPMYTKNDPSVHDSKSRQGGISFGINGLF